VVVVAVAVAVVVVFFLSAPLSVWHFIILSVGFGFSFFLFQHELVFGLMLPLPGCFNISFVKDKLIHPCIIQQSSSKVNSILTYFTYGYMELFSTTNLITKICNLQSSCLIKLLQ